MLIQNLVSLCSDELSEKSTEKLFFPTLLTVLNYSPRVNVSEYYTETKLFLVSECMVTRNQDSHIQSGVNNITIFIVF